MRSKNVRSLICLLTVIVMMINLNCFTVFASTQENGLAEADTDASIKDVLSFTCVYNAETKKVTVSGSMHHEAFAEHNNSTLVIYAIPPGMTEQQVADNSEMSPLAEAEVSIRFGFTFNANNIVDIYSRYAIFLRSTDGALTLGTEAQYPELEVNVERVDDGSAFKGVMAPSASFAASVAPGITVLPVYLDSLYTSSSGGYVYQGDGEILFFEKNYVDGLDGRINTIASTGSRIYLQLLLRGGDTFAHSDGEAEYYMPDVYQSRVLDLLHSAVNFLVTRYNDANGGCLEGFVIGKAWDNYSKYNFALSDSLDDYAKRCGLYTVIVANSARSVDPTLDIVLPFSEVGFSTDLQYQGKSGEHFSVRALAEAVIEYLKNSFSSGLKCSLMIESAQVPFGISNSTVDSGIDTDFSDYSSQIYAGGQQAFSLLLDSLRSSYSSLSTDYVFVWTPPEKLCGTALEAAYAYSYYALLGDEHIYAFVADLSESACYTDVKKIMKSIDTIYGASATAHLPEYFGADGWKAIKGVTSVATDGAKHVYTAEAMTQLPEKCIGRFNYFDFSNHILTDNWKRGVGCGGLRLEYSSKEDRALRAALSLIGTEEAQLIYKYDQYENMIHTPYLKIDLKIDGAIEKAKYRITLVLEGKNGRYESSCIINGDEIQSAVFDISEYAYFNKIEGFRLSVASLNDADETCDMWIYGISGHSDKYASNKLQELISQDRDSMREDDVTDEEGSYLERAAIAVGLVIIVGALGMGLFITFKHNGKSDGAEKEEDT